jgi:hypothetical protein
MNPIHHEKRKNPFFMYDEMTYLTNLQVLLRRDMVSQLIISFRLFPPTRLARCTHAAV